ncbi:hypothetical protein QBC34DRAFT_379285 [Podospora aff. communis PSN243]|uniref:Uncharacterized protein n=1 Tax=Podospora aff. communis PSN243 TaxID=3040156 RepID=A0AAV9GSN7_9PEZI|nr:hypothetical protein QBC34DRAFT_379285 [Podospora aff. communis PSN243]
MTKSTPVALPTPADTTPAGTMAAPSKAKKTRTVSIIKLDSSNFAPNPTKAEDLSRRRTAANNKRRAEAAKAKKENMKAAKATEDKKGKKRTPKSQKARTPRKEPPAPIFIISTAPSEPPTSPRYYMYSQSSIKLTDDMAFEFGYVLKPDFRPVRLNLKSFHRQGRGSPHGGLIRHDDFHSFQLRSDSPGVLPWMRSQLPKEAGPQRPRCSLRAEAARSLCLPPLSGA